MTCNYSHIVVGGGLHGGLISLALLTRDPDARIALIERGARLGGNHTWSFHAADVSPPAMRFVAPLVSHQWRRHEVRFPTRSRVLGSSYRTIASTRFHDVVTAAFARGDRADLLLDATVETLSADQVTLADGTRLTADAVFDARGPSAGDVPGGTGYQKFVGQELELESNHELAHPILMDATVPQHDGFRFVYVLPMTPRRLLVEDTYFSDWPDLDRDAVRERIGEYASAAGMKVRSVAREEWGVLPMPWRAHPSPSEDGIHRVGYRGGWFHPATAYSLACGARVAEAVAETPAQDLRARLGAMRRDHDRQARYARVLNALLFTCFSPEARRNVFERFYRLPAPTIARFYALEMTATDRVRILAGRPPRGFEPSRALRTRKAVSA